MDVKQTLRQYRPALQYARKCFRELDDARNEGLRSPRLDGMPRGGGGNGLDEQIARIDALERKAAKARQKALDLAEEIEDMIDSLEDNRYKTVLSMRYLKGFSWVKVAMEMNYAEKYVFALHGKAIEELRRRQNGLEKDRKNSE